MASEIARQLQVTDRDGREVLFTQWRKGDIEREYLDGKTPPIYVGYLLPHDKTNENEQYRQHKRFKETVALHTWNISYHEAVYTKKFAPALEPKPKKTWGKTDNTQDE